MRRLSASRLAITAVEKNKTIEIFLGNYCEIRVIPRRCIP